MNVTVPLPDSSAAETWRPCCADCGSDNVARNARASWDTATRRWTLLVVFDHSECLDCGGLDALDWASDATNE